MEVKEEVKIRGYISIFDQNKEEKKKKKRRRAGKERTQDKKTELTSIWPTISADIAKLDDMMLVKPLNKGGEPIRLDLADW